MAGEHLFAGASQIAIGAALAVAGAGEEPPPEPTGDIVMPLGVRNYSDAEVSANSLVQFGVPIALAEALGSGAYSVAMERDSDGEPIPVQLDMESTRRVGGTVQYLVATARVPFAVAAETTVACTMIITKGGTYSGGSAPVSVSDLEALDIKVEITGSDVTTLAVASFNDYVYRRQIKSGAVCAGWEGWSRAKEGGNPAGHWNIRWRAWGKGTALADWIIEVNVYCCHHLFDATGGPFTEANGRGRTGTFVLKSGSTTLISGAPYSSLFMTGNTGFKFYAYGDSRRSYGQAALRPVHDQNYLVASRAIFPFRFAAADTEDGTRGGDAIGSFADAYTPTSLGGFPALWTHGGIDGSIGPVSGVSHNMLYDLASDTRWKRGYDAGLKQLSISHGNFDPAHGFHRPRFGTYSGLPSATTALSSAAAGTNRRVYNPDNTQRMNAEWGHYCETAYVPALLTADLAVCDPLTWCLGYLTQVDMAFAQPKVAGRSRRQAPWMRPVTDGARYTAWPLRMETHADFVFDDARPDKAYIRAHMAEHQSFATDIWIDKLAWEDSGPSGSAIAGNNANRMKDYDGGGTSGAYLLGFWSIATDQTGAWDHNDRPWQADYAAYVWWMLRHRNGETWIDDLFSSWMSNYYIETRALGSGACVAYGAEYTPIVCPLANDVGNANRYTMITTRQPYWDDYYGSGTYPQSRGGVCPATRTTGNDDYVKNYTAIARLYTHGNIPGSSAHSWAELVDALEACWPEAMHWPTANGRWVMTEAAP
jgi:hypothetical protein